MKKSLCILLAAILLLLCVVPTVTAQAADDKISPDVRALIDANPDGGIKNGVVVEVFHHNPDYPTEGVSEQEAVENNLKAQSELIRQIKELTYMEGDGFSIGRFFVGLPFTSIEAVAALPYVDYIDLPHDEYSDLPAQQKLDFNLKTAMEQLIPETKVEVTLWFAYNEHAYIGVPEPEDTASNSQVEYYQKTLRSKRRDYHTAKNQAFAAVVRENAAVDSLTCSALTPMAFAVLPLSEVVQLASLKEVAQVWLDRVAYVPHVDPQTIEEKFENWMYDTKRLVKFDPELAEKGLQSWELGYYDYNELYTSDSWALVYAETNICEPWEYVGHICIGDRVLSWYRPGAAVYPYGYFVYSAAEDTFYPIERFVEPVYTQKTDENGKWYKEITEPTILLDDYPGLLDVLDELNIGVVRGDADGDGQATILDATLIQRYKADMIAETGLDLAAADADGDGDVAILDATRVQRTVADICDITGAPKQP